MPAAPIPAHEAERLAALRSYDILDTPAEADFDGFTRLAAQICGTPVALISLIDAERQWFKSQVGTEVNNLPREVAFCAHALERREVLEVPNAAEDARFRDNPLVTQDPKIRFYAGAPLMTPDGLGLGTLCVLDRQPRQLSDAQREALALLGRQVVNQFELRRLNARLDQEVTRRTRQLEESTRALAASEERFRQLAEQSSDGFWFVSLGPFQVRYVNPAVERIWGVPAAELLKGPEAWLAAIHPDDRTAVDQAMRAAVAGETPRFEAEYRVVRPDGAIRWVWASGTPIKSEQGEILRMGGISRDVTDRKQAEANLRRTQRLESIGTLAGGIAHDLNNTLSPILMGIEILRAKHPDSGTTLERMETSARRGAGMVKQVLTFAKGVEGAKNLVDPRALLLEIAGIAQGSFPPNIRLQLAEPGKLHRVLGDATQLHQVLLNLCVNARDAMPQGGTLSLAGENAHLDESQARAAGSDAKPGRYVAWRVRDSGTGIPPKVLERIFEPFFTTKGPQKGTGLGLSTVLGIVQSHGGFMTVESAPGQGSHFSVYLPASVVGAEEG